LSVIAVGDQVLLPFSAGLFGILVPPDAVGLPGRRDHVRCAIVVHVDRPLAAVGNKLAHCARLAILMTLPLAAVGAGVLIPVGSTDDVGKSITVHIERGDALSVIRAKAVRKKRDLRNAAWSRAWRCPVFALRRCRNNRGSEKNKRNEAQF